MKIAVCSTPEQYDQLLSRGLPVGITTVIQSCDDLVTQEADMYIDLLFNENNNVFSNITQKPVFVNEVIQTNAAIPENYIRINGWKTFLEREVLELAANDTMFFAEGINSLKTLGWKYQLAPDVPGMISARIITMIINEAYFALGEDLSSKKEMDIAMKTGTNYPYGPFEWGEKIGLKNVYALLNKLSEDNDRYTPAPHLVQEILLSNAEKNSPYKC